MPIGSPGCVTRPRRSPPEARWISGAQGGGLTQRRAAVIRQVFDEVLLIRALLNERRRSESNRRIEVLQTSALPLGYGAETRKLAIYMEFLNPPRERFQAPASQTSASQFGHAAATEIDSPPHSVSQLARLRTRDCWHFCRHSRLTQARSKLWIPYPVIRFLSTEDPPPRLGVETRRLAAHDGDTS